MDVYQSWGLITSQKVQVKNIIYINISINNMSDYHICTKIHMLWSLVFQGEEETEGEERNTNSEQP